MSGRRSLLANRHIQFIAIGGAIGAGLFLGSGAAIESAGPALLLAYAMCGGVTFLMARALGELTLYDPAAGSFSTYAERYIGVWAGYVTGWSYWANWILGAAAEITATGIFTRFWFPGIPQWIPALLALILIFIINRRTVRFFGEVEFWLALVKIVAILVFIVGGALSLALRPMEGAAVSNLWTHGGFFPHGMAGIVAILPIALFAFGGSEVIGLTAADAQDPERSIPRAINGVIARILVFYLGSMFVIMSMAPWTQFSAGESPFVSTLARAGIPAAAGIVNFIVMSAILSSCNTGLYATGRMLSALAERHHAPGYLAQRDPDGLPRRAINASAGMLLVVVVLNWLIPDKVFEMVISAAALLLLWVWFVIMVSHLRFRRVAAPTGSTRSFRLPFSPYSNWLVIAFVLIAALVMGANERSRPAFLIIVSWAALLLLAFYQRHRRMLSRDRHAV